MATNYLWRIQKPHKFYLHQGGIFTGKNTNAWSEMNFFEIFFSSKVSFEIAEGHECVLNRCLPAFDTTRINAKF